jgi:large subunit ribosomal protein L9
MAQTVELLLVENVEHLGIVGDIVNVRPGYARNFLLPRELATEPSQELIEQLADRRKAAQEEMARLRAAREQMVSALEGFQLKIIKTANDQGLLYGSVTQQDIAELLGEEGHSVRPSDVRLGQVIKRVGEYDITVKPEQELEANIHLTVEPEGGFPEEDLEDEEAEGEAGAEGEASAEAEGDLAREAEAAAEAEESAKS